LKRLSTVESNKQNYIKKGIRKKKVPKKVPEPAETGKIITYGELKDYNSKDLEYIRQASNSAGVLRRIRDKQMAFYNSTSEQLHGLTMAQKKLKMKQIRNARTNLSDAKPFSMVDVIDPLPISLDEDRPSTNDVSIANHSPSIQLKAAGVQTPSALTTKTYDDAILEQKFGKDWKERITDTFDDPYDEKSKWRWHDGFRADGSAQGALISRSEFTMGAEYTTTQIDTTQNFAGDREKEQKEIERLNKVPLYKWMKKMCDKFDRDMKFNYWAQGQLIQHWQYGRALMIVQDDPKTGLPIALKLLNAMRLGRVFCEILTYKPVAIEYVDYKPPENIIMAENCVYMVNKNYHNSPNTLWFGISDYEVIRDVLETNILIESIDIKEINKRLWAAIILVRVFSEDEEAVTALRMALKTGKSVFATIDYEAQQLKIEHDLQGLLTEREKNQDKIYGDLGVPKLVGLGDTDAVTKSAASIVAHAWNQGPLKKHKLLASGNYEEQYYNQNLLKLARYRANLLEIDDDDIEEMRQEIEDSERDDLEYERKEPKEEKELVTWLLAQKVVDWPFKLKMVMKDIDFSTPLEKAALATTLKAAEVIDQVKALEIMDYKDMLDRLKEDGELDAQVKQIIQQLMAQGMDPANMDVPTLFKALMDKAPGAGGLGPEGEKKPGAVNIPTLEDLKSGQEKKGKGLGASDLTKSVLSKTKVPAPKVGVTNA
jgi:hypothetical protein